MRNFISLGFVLLTMLGVTMRPAISANGQVSSQVNNGEILAEVADGPHALLSKDFSSQLLEGQRYYDAGQLMAAVESWHQAAEELAVDPLDEAVSWGYVSVASQDLGDWSQAEAAITRALSLLADSDSGHRSMTVRAQVLNAQGRLYLKMGKPELAWETWGQAEDAYKQADDWLGHTGAQINQSQALQTMGLYRRARLQLTDITEVLASQPNSAVKATALKSLGTVYQTAGSLEQSFKYLTESLELYQQLGSNTEIADVQLALANTLRLMSARDTAIDLYQQVEQLVPGSTLSVTAKLNRFSLLLDIQKWSSARALLPELVTRLQDLPASRLAIYNRVSLVESLLSQEDRTIQLMNWLSVDQIATLLTESIQQAQLLQDSRAESLALGELSKLYGHVQQWSDSQELAKRALALSQVSNASDLAYRWQQQLGKAYHEQNKNSDAIASYTNAVETLGQVRRDLLATNADIQFSFRETVEPVYRELVSLLLLPDDVSESSLSQARSVIEDLQLAELENYFKSACIDSTGAFIDRLDNTAAVLYPIVLKDRVEVIASLPGLPLRHYRTWQTENQTNQTLSELFQYFNPVLSTNKRLRLSKEVYDWLITPVENALIENDLQTLVFVLDGKFRNIPMAALYDGEQYLLEKYSVALTPGMKLLGPHLQKPKPLQALMLGLTEARSGFSALPGVKDELDQISASVSAEVFFNEDFTHDSLAASLDRVPFPILHLATHGQFSSDLNETFLLAWDQKITISDLDALLQARRQKEAPIELMVLSACQTAEGDDRATLGLAGMAIRSGARSTLATLWAVNDESTASLMREFYIELENTDLSKAQALRQAQIKTLKDPQFSHPFYWSPFVLIGNWLS